METWTVLIAILVIALLGLVVLGAVAMFRSRRQPATAAGGHSGYTGFAGSSAEWPATPRHYNPMKVGNDASARPWEDETIPVQDTVQDTVGANWNVPPGFDTDGFLVVAKRNFVTLQDAWDRSDVGTLRAMMTDEMLDQIHTRIAEAGGAAAQRTEVEMLEAQLLGIEELGNQYMTTVEFSGMIREEPSAGASPFREVWNMVKPKDGSAGWLVAGVQALQ